MIVQSHNRQTSHRNKRENTDVADECTSTNSANNVFKSDSESDENSKTEISEKNEINETPSRNEKDSTHTTYLSFQSDHPHSPTCLTTRRDNNKMHPTAEMSEMDLSGCSMDASLMNTDVDSIGSSCSSREKSSLPNQSSLCTYRKSSDVAAHVKSIPSLDTHFKNFRLQYLIVHTAIMLADGLQGTHLYVLYQGYGYSVASLYSLGFVSGAITSPFIGPLVDRIGRKRAAIAYCILEIIINILEQYPLFIGLILSRVVGGITTNLLFSVFESWLVTEHRLRGFKEDKLEIILRDSTIVSNSAAIVSGYLAHHLASYFGPVGPFEGAVAFTGLAMVLVGMIWTENYGNSNTLSPKVSTFKQHMVEAFRTITSDSKISRIGIIQGLTEGSLQTFVFLWSPALLAFSESAVPDALGLDINGVPAYGLIFGGFMMCGVLGGFLEPTVRKLVTNYTGITNSVSKDEIEEDDNDDVNPVAVCCLCAFCYIAGALLLLTPCLVEKGSPYAFTICFSSFLMYELMVGLYMPCEGVIRAVYMPNSSMCSIMTMLRVIVNVAVALGVISTNYISVNGAFYTLSVMMASAALLQISLIPEKYLLKSVYNICGPSNAVDTGKKTQ